MRLWPFGNRETVTLRPADEYGDGYEYGGEGGLPPGVRYGPHRAPPPEWIIANELWATDFDLSRRGRLLMQRIWKLQQHNGQVWSVTKSIKGKNSRYASREVATFLEFPTVDQLRAKVLPEHGGGTYDVWALKPQPPAMVFQFILTETNLDEEAAQDAGPAKPTKPADPFAQVDAAVAEHIATNPAALERIVGGVMEKRFGVKEEKPVVEKPEDAEFKQFLSAHPEIAEKAMAARWAKRLGLKVKDLLPGAEDDEDDFTRLGKMMGKVKKYGELFGLTPQPIERGPSMFAPILDGFGRMLGNTDPVKLFQMIGAGTGPKQAALPAPATLTPTSAPESMPAAAEPDTAAPAPTTPVAEGEVMSPAALPATPADGDNYKHLLPNAYTPDCKWAEYPPSATSKEALEKIGDIVDKDEALQWLMGLDWAMLQQQLQLRVDEFAQWLAQRAKSGDHGWVGLFNVLSRLHPRSMLLVFRRGLEIPLVRLSAAGSICQSLTTEQGAAYLTYAMALLHEARVQYHIGVVEGEPTDAGPELKD